MTIDIKWHVMSILTTLVEFGYWMLLLDETKYCHDNFVHSTNLTNLVEGISSYMCKNAFFFIARQVKTFIKIILNKKGNCPKDLFFWFSNYFQLHAHITKCP
jgi:hypothetical protein